GSLEDALRADVDPRPRGHLAVHGEPGPLELPEGLPVGPLRYEHRIRDQDTRSHGMRSEDPDRLAGLDQECLVGFQPPQGPDDLVEGLPAPGGLAGPTVD